MKSFSPIETLSVQLVTQATQVLEYFQWDEALAHQDLIHHLDQIQSTLDEMRKSLGESLKQPY